MGVQPTQTVRHQFTIEAPPEAVWETLTDVASAPEWVAGVRRTERLPGPRREVGEQWLQVDVYGPLVLARVYEVTAFEPPVRHEMESVVGLPARVRHTLEPAGEGTRATFEMGFEPPLRWVSALVGPAANEAAAKRVLERTAAALKRRLEGRWSAEVGRDVVVSPVEDAVERSRAR